MNTKIRPFTPSTIHAQLGLAMLLLGLVLSACGAGARTTSSDLLEAVKQRRVLRIATDANYKPQSFKNSDGSWSGFDIDVAHEIARRIGVEAAAALGMTPRQTLRRIVLPQAVRIILPDLGNQFIALQKDTALASAIALPELISLARQAGAPRQHLFEALLVAAGWYWLLTIVLSWVQSRLERRMARGDR